MMSTFAEVLHQRMEESKTKTERALEALKDEYSRYDTLIDKAHADGDYKKRDELIREKHSLHMSQFL